MIAAFLTGFMLGFSLILAIGAQNAFVLRQGILGHHVFYVALFCAIADIILIFIGVTGISFFFNTITEQTSNWLFRVSALWVAGYGFLRLHAVFKKEINIKLESTSSKTLLSTLSIAAVLTFGNPHVYLDTMVLIGSVSQQFNGESRLLFASGASLASVIFFFTLAYGAKLLAKKFQNRLAWQILDLTIALIMFIIAIKLAFAGNWL